MKQLNVKVENETISNLLFIQAEIFERTGNMRTYKDIVASLIDDLAEVLRKDKEGLIDGVLP